MTAAASVRVYLSPSRLALLTAMPALDMVPAAGRHVDLFG